MITSKDISRKKIEPFQCQQKHFPDSKSIAKKVPTKIYAAKAVEGTQTENPFLLFRSSTIRCNGITDPQLTKPLHAYTMKSNLLLIDYSPPPTEKEIDNF
jgi:hypothetical protein